MSYDRPLRQVPDGDERDRSHLPGELTAERFGQPGTEQRRRCTCTGPNRPPSPRPAAARATIVVVIDHVSLQCLDLEVSAALIASLAARGAAGHGLRGGHRYGVPPKPEFWIGSQTTGTGFREVHLAFAAADREAVRGFFRVAVELGAEVLHEPRVWPEYHDTYYAAFVRDPDGNNAEAVCHRPE